MKYLRFVFVGEERDWRPLEGHTPPPGRVVELFAYPGGASATGPTFEAAVKNLQDLLDQMFTRAASPEEWYRSAMESDGDRFAALQRKLAENLGGRGEAMWGLSQDLKLRYEVLEGGSELATC